VTQFQYLSLFSFYNHQDEERFFTRADRSRMVHDLLIRTRYDRSNSARKFRFGIDRLLANGSYSAAYPLHDGFHDPPNKEGELNDRQLLYQRWAHPKNVWQMQPICLVKNYFGMRLAFYFAYFVSWLGWDFSK